MVLVQGLANVTAAFPEGLSMLCPPERHCEEPNYSVLHLQGEDSDSLRVARRV